MLRESLIPLGSVLCFPIAHYIIDHLFVLAEDKSKHFVWNKIRLITCTICLFMNYIKQSPTVRFLHLYHSRLSWLSAVLTFIRLKFTCLKTLKHLILSLNLEQRSPAACLNETKPLSLSAEMHAGKHTL